MEPATVQRTALYCMRFRKKMRFRKNLIKKYTMCDFIRPNLCRWQILCVYCPFSPSFSQGSFFKTSTPSPPPVSFLLASATEYSWPTWYCSQKNMLTQLCMYLILEKQWFKWPYIVWLVINKQLQRNCYAVLSGDREMKISLCLMFQPLNVRLP